MKPICVLLLVSASFTANLCATEDSVGWITAIDGQWTINGAPAQLGQSVPPGAKITGNLRDDGAQRITVALFNGNTTSWPDGKESDPMLIVPKHVTEAPPLRSRVLHAVAALFSKEPERYVATISRGARTGALREAVVFLREGKIEIAPVFKEMKPGNYRLQFDRLSEGDTDQPAASPLRTTYDWRPDKAAPADAGSLATGLYRLALLDPIKEEPLGPEAWVLVAGANNGDLLAQAFQDAKELSAKWDGKSGNQTQTSFLRATLEAISKPDFHVEALSR